MDSSRKGKGVVENDNTPLILLTMREATQLLNVHSNTLRRWGDRGIIRVYRIGPGGHRRYRQEDIVALCIERPDIGKRM